MIQKTLERERKLGKNLSLKLRFTVRIDDGAKKGLKQLRQKGKNAKRLDDFYCVFLRISGSLLAFFLLRLVSILFFSSIDP